MAMGNYGMHTEFVNISVVHMIIRYDFTKGVSNLPGRPINFVINATSRSVFQNLRFIQSQFWTMVVNSTKDTVLQNVYINSTSFDSVRAPCRDTNAILMSLIV
jgi:galacturan 1,4-alpha-galacturonidase